MLSYFAGVHLSYKTYELAIINSLLIKNLRIHFELKQLTSKYLKIEALMEIAKIDENLGTGLL